MGTIIFISSSDSRRLPKPSNTMQTAIVFLCAVAMSQAYVYYGYPSYYNIAAAPLAGNTVCSPQQVTACKNFLGATAVPVSAFNCEGQCGLCDLCEVAQEEVPECRTHCIIGKTNCVATCEKGKAICIGCGVSKSFSLFKFENT